MSRPPTSLLSRRSILRGSGLLACWAVGGFALAGCGASGPFGRGGDVVTATVARATPSAAAGERGAVALRRFACALLPRLLDGEPGNLACSPMSVAIALGMTANGARGRTATEMLGVLHAESVEQLNEGLAACVAAVEGLAGEGERRDGSAYEIALDTANSLWAQRDLEWQRPFLEALGRWFGAGVHTVDYRSAAEEARQEINGWTSERTHEKIPELVPQGALDQLTRLVLVNALYLKAPWEEPFTKAVTRPEPFTFADGARREVPMMRTGLHTGYAAGSGWRAAALPYAGRALAMTLVLPDDPSPAAAAAWFTPDNLAQALRPAAQTQVDIMLPRWTFRYTRRLKDILSQLGMPLACTDSADFTGMTESEPIYISEVVHETFIAVDEEGTEAAAATAVTMAAGAAPAEPQRLVLDRPFLFVIHDVATGVPLFAGRVAEPAG